MAQYVSMDPLTDAPLEPMLYSLLWFFVDIQDQSTKALLDPFGRASAGGPRRAGQDFLKFQHISVGTLMHRSVL